MISGARLGIGNRVHRFVATMQARELAAFVVPGIEVARAFGLDPEAAGLRIAVSPRHADLILLVGEIPEGLAQAVAIVYAQMPRPRAIVAVGTGSNSTLPAPDVSIALNQESLVAGIAELRSLVANGSFNPDASGFDIAETRAETVYVCPMHPEIVRTEPGLCPICGMRLVPSEAANGDIHGDMSATHGREADQEAAEFANTAYTCPMHPEVVQSKPGTCPICGMTLVPRQSTTQEAGRAGHSSGPTSRDTDDNDQAGQSAPSTDHHLHSPSDRSHAHHERHDNVADRVPHDTHEQLTNHQASGDQHSMMSPDMHEMQRDPHDGAEGRHSHGGTDMHSMATMDHGAHTGMMGGFMSMVAMTKGLPRSRDGLPMEWVEAPFGPLFPGLPGGLDVAFTLDGDDVAQVRVSGAMMSRQLAQTWPGPSTTFPDRLARLDPLAPVAYRLLAFYAIEHAAGILIDPSLARQRIAALEWQRVISHLNWLAAFGAVLGDRWIAQSAAALHLRVVGSSVATGIDKFQTDLSGFIQRLGKTPLLKRRLDQVGILAEATDALGPVARANGKVVDARLEDRSYRGLDFAPVVVNSGDAHGRLQVRLGELTQSLALIQAVDVHAAQETPPIAEASGAGTATIETPRGAATLHVTLVDGRIQEVHLTAPSMRNVGFVPVVATGQEVADALVSIASLDLSPWELNR